MRSDRGAVGLLLLAIYLPLVLISMFAAIEISLWYRANAALELAAGEVARVANAAVLASGNNPTPTEKSLLTWQSNGATLDNSLKGALQRCLATGQTSDSATIENLKECYATWQALKASPTDINLGFVPAGIKNSASFSNPLFAPHFTELPFALWDPHPTTPSFSQVQYLPTICIRNGCHEPYNESASSTVGECSYRRPICWSVHDGSLDFDGDGNNDLVFFRPTGSGPNIDSNTIKDADFIVYPSANGYALSGSDSFFDLSEERAPSAPADLPVVGDYDGDGKADPAVFNPQTATVTVLPSRGQYAIRVIFDVSAAVDPDPLGQEATIAIPGHYLSNAFEIAFVKTASASPQTRYDIGIAAFTHGFDGLEDLVTQGIKTISGSTAVNKLSAMKFKPPLGNIAIPAFADYNQDGRTELGYLSYPGGNRTKWIAGSPKQKGIYYTPYTTASHPLAVKINPFDLKLDSKGVLYFVDAIAARIFRIMPGENGGFDGLKQDALLLSDVDDSSESLQLVVNAVSSNPLKIINQILPRFSVWNIPKPLFPLLGADPGTAAADRLLVEPRRIAIGPDDVLYVADKAGRILRFEPSGTSVSSSSLGSEVLGSFTCMKSPASCQPLSATLTQSAATYSGSEFSDVQFNPIALTIVPDPSGSDRYNLAFSSGGGVYLLTNNGGGGPRGQSGEKVLLLAGTLGPENNTPPAQAITLQSAIGTQLCPVVDLAFDLASFNGGSGVAALIAASSCTNPIQPALQKASGIVAIRADSASFTSNPTTTTINSIIGNFLRDPKTTWPTPLDKMIRRTVDITPGKDPLSIDLVNVTDVEVTAAGDIFFTVQWTQPDPDGVFTSPGFDRQYIQALYRYAAQSKTLETLTNPKLFGDGSIPVQDIRVFSPNTNDSETPWDLPRTAPLKLAPFPVGGALALAPDLKSLFVSHPPVANDGVIVPAESFAPYRVSPDTVGSIIQITLDLDGDGISDYRKGQLWKDPPQYEDTDIDGDLKNNESDSLSGRSPYCAELSDSAFATCRLQEILGHPKWVAMSATGSKLKVPGNFGVAELDVDFIEFDLLSSVSENDLTLRSRPESWASLFDYKSAFGLPSTNSTFLIDGNGPIAAPVPLHTFVGMEEGLFPSRNSYPDLHDRKNFLFPFIRASLAPHENGIKPVRRAWSSALSATQFPKPKILATGTLCWRDTFSPESVGKAPAPFRYRPLQYLLNMSHSADLTAVGAVNQSDLVEYRVECASPSDTVTLADGRTVAQEAIILQIDHDEVKPGGFSKTWPNSWFTGKGAASDPDNLRIFNVADLDGDAVPNPVWISREVAVNPTNGALHQRALSRPMVVAIGRLRDDKESFLINMNQARKPYALSTLITNGANAPAGPEVGPFDVSNEDLPQYPIFVSGITFPLGTDPTKFFFEYTSPFSPPDRRGGLIAALDFQPALPSEAVDSIDTFATPDYATRAESTDNRFTQSSDGLIAKAAVKTMQKLLPVNEVVVGESSGWSDNRLTVVMTNLDGSACGAKSCAAIKLQYQYTSLFTPRTIERQVVMLNQIDQSN